MTTVNLLGVPLATVRQAVTAALPPPAGEVPAPIPFDQQARKVLELTFREALRLGHNYIGTEHILLALLELEDGKGAFSGLGIGKAAAQAQVAAALAAIRGAHQGQ
jgi:ATP-dependent Clp protease ATP-binding subunit ClpA